MGSLDPVCHCVDFEFLVADEQLIVAERHWIKETAR